MAARNASWAMSSAAAASWTIRKAARCAGPQCARKSASMASCEPACAARTQARSDRRDGRARSAGPSRAALRSIADARARAELILAPTLSTGKPAPEVPWLILRRGCSSAITRGRLRGQGERYDPLPAFLLLPARAWRRLSRRGRLIVVAIAVVGVGAIAASWPSVEREKHAGEAQRARAAAARHAAHVRQLTEDQRPRRAPLSEQDTARIRAAGGLRAGSSAGLAGARMELAIARDIRSRIAAGKLAGPLLGTSCDAVSVRSRGAANYNCFALTGRARVGGRVLESGYRFSARAELAPATLVWCKENPRPLHPTSYVVSVPISKECR